MVSRNGDTFSFAFGIIGGVLALLALVLTCIGLGLPSWYVANNLNGTLTLAQANLFSTCYVPNATQTTKTSEQTCVSFASFSCSTSSYFYSIFNASTYASGCTNPNRDSGTYYDFDGPIAQTPIDSFYRLRASAALSIVSILFIFCSAIFGLLTAIVLLNVYLVFIAPVLATFAVVFGVCCLVLAGSVFNYTGTGFALYVAGILLETIALLLLALVAGRLNAIGMKKSNEEEEEAMVPEHPNQRVLVRRMQKRRY